MSSFVSIPLSYFYPLTFFRLPSILSASQRKIRVEEVMKELGITHIRNSKIGSPIKRGVSTFTCMILAIKYSLTLLDIRRRTETLVNRHRTLAATSFTNIRRAN